MPAITKNTFGKGCTYYIGTNMGQEGIDKVLKMATQQAGVHPVVKEPTALEVVCRKTANSTHYYIFNFKETEIVIPDQFVGYTDLLTGKKVESGMRMKHYDALILNIPDTGVSSPFLLLKCTARFATGLCVFCDFLTVFFIKMCYNTEKRKGGCV